MTSVPSGPRDAVRLGKLKPPSRRKPGESLDPFADVTAPRSGMVRLAAQTGSQLTVIRTGPVEGDGSVGGWQQSERVLLEDADWWSGPTKPTITIPALIDITEIGGPSLERRLDVLYAMGDPVDDDDPPAVRLYGDVLPRYRRRLWKIDNITPGESDYRPDAPTQLQRLKLSIALSGFAPTTGVTRVGINRTRVGGKRRRRTITVRRGDTLRAIAVRQLGSSNDYKLIREWNPKLKRTDPDAPLRVGLKIVLR